MSSNICKLLDGKLVAEDIYREIQERIKKDLSIKPFLVVVQVGNDPASSVYIKYKRLACARNGFDFRLDQFEANTTTDELVKVVDNLNNDILVTGIIVQLPLPDHINQMTVLNSIKPKKDVDCFSYENIGRMYYGKEVTGHLPATAWGILRMLQFYKIETKGKLCVILGKSPIVGRPLSLLLNDEFGAGCTVVSCDKNTENRKQLTQMADILVVATGVHHLIKNPTEIKQNCVIIDVGIHSIGTSTDKRIVEGDVDHDMVKNKCEWITPVPGGVGPTTVATLMYNLAKPFFEL